MINSCLNTFFIEIPELHQESLPDTILNKTTLVVLTSSLKDRDSHYWTAMPGRENVPGRVYVALVSDTALHSLIPNPAIPFSHESGKAPQLEQVWVV